MARSAALGSAPVPYRCDLDLEVGADWITRRLDLTPVGDGWARSLLLERDADGCWSGRTAAAGTTPEGLQQGSLGEAIDPGDIPPELLDVDVQASPLTNLMRRLGLTETGAAGRFTMAWVSVPALAVSLDVQQYTLLGPGGVDVCARFDSGDGLFAAVLRSDADGVVLEYPGIARRLP